MGEGEDGKLTGPVSTDAQRTKESLELCVRDYVDSRITRISTTVGIICALIMLGMGLLGYFGLNSMIASSVESKVSGQWGKTIKSETDKIEQARRKAEEIYETATFANRIPSIEKEISYLKAQSEAMRSGMIWLDKSSGATIMVGGTALTFELLDLSMKNGRAEAKLKQSLGSDFTLQATYTLGDMGQAKFKPEPCMVPSITNLVSHQRVYLLLDDIHEGKSARIIYRIEGTPLYTEALQGKK